MYRFILIAFILCSFSCERNKAVSSKSCKHTGVLKDFKGLDGCRFLVVLKNGEKLQVTNFEAFNVTFDQLKNGQKVTLSYVAEQDMAGICMVGKMVKLTCLKIL